MARNKEKLIKGLNDALNIAPNMSAAKIDAKTLGDIKLINLKIANAMADIIHSYIDDARVDIKNIKIAAGIPINATGVSPIGPVNVTGYTTIQGTIDISDPLMIEASSKIL